MVYGIPSHLVNLLATEILSLLLDIWLVSSNNLFSISVLTCQRQHQ